VLALYLVTMAPSTAMWDTSEYIAAAYVFGIPHPPGNPFFIILGHLFSLLPIAPNVASRINVLAAISSAVSGSPPTAAQACRQMNGRIRFPPSKLAGWNCSSVQPRW